MPIRKLRCARLPPLGVSNLTASSLCIVGTYYYRDIRNSASYSNDQTLMPGANVRIFANVKY